MSRILIVDDYEENLYLLKVLLEGNGHATEHARNGSEALVKALGDPPDLIVSDILMPVIDGFTLCRIWKADDRLTRIPFIFYTATYTDPRDEKLALDMGADAFIVKPIEPDEFISRVERVLETSKRGKPSAPGKPSASEETILKNYNEALIRKLEHKMLNLEKLNRELEDEITARHQAEASMRESEERYRLLFEYNMDGVMLTEPGDAILSANPAACRIFGRDEEELRNIGRKGVFDTGDPRHAEAIRERDATGRFSGELTAIRKDGTAFPCEVYSSVFKDSEGNVKNGIFMRDITERKSAERQILATLQEKDALLKEIHHRVKNNMQVISSLINLQLHSNLKNMPPNEITNISVDLQNRIQSMAIVHEMLYQSKNLSKIDLNEYINNLIRSLFSSFNTNVSLISLNIDITDKPVSISTAVPLGLIINELLTNTLKYAFPSGEKGDIHIAVKLDGENMYHVTVRDSGIGLPPGFNMENIATFGMRLVSILLKQLKGTIECRNDDGAVFMIHFPKNDTDGRLALNGGQACNAMTSADVQ